MLDTTPITKLITAGTTEQALLTAVAQLFPNLTPVELSAALQDATAAAERQVVKARATDGRQRKYVVAQLALGRKQWTSTPTGRAASRSERIISKTV